MPRDAYAHPMRAALLVLACLLASGCLSAVDVLPWTRPVEPGRGPAPSAPRAAFGCSTECGVTVAQGTYREFEPTIAVNPLHPNVIAVSAAEDLMADSEGWVEFPLGLTSPVTGANGPLQTPGSYRFGVHTSVDGGRTWATHWLPWTGNAPATSLWNLFAVYGDPLIAYDAKGVLHAVGVSAGVATELKVDQQFHLFHAASTDDGATWGEPSLIAPGEFVVVANDKPWMAIDPGTGDIAVAWTHFVALGFATQTLMVMVSHDGGATWGLPHPVVLGGIAENLVDLPVLEEPAYNYFVGVVWGEDHALHVGYTGYCATRPNLDRPDCMKSITSPDGGETWPASPVLVQPVQDPDRQGSRHTMANYASMAVDRSGGAHDGRVYMAYKDMSQGDYDVLVSWSDDHGASWQSPKRLSTDPRGNGADQFQQGIDVDRHGLLHAVFWDRRADPGNLLVQAVHATWNPDTGLLTNTFLESPWDPDPGHVDGQFLGDYNAVSAAAGKVALVWDVATPQKPGTHNTQIPWDLDVRALVLDAP